MWMHAALWVVAMFALGLAFREESAPTGPRFNSAFRFIGRIDLFVSASAQELATDAAIKAQTWLGLNLNLMEVVLFGCFVLFLGTLQWFLVGRFLGWLSAKFGNWCASLVGAGVGFCVWLTLLFWIMRF